jgi:hypothetical protein
MLTYVLYLKSYIQSMQLIQTIIKIGLKQENIKFMFTCGWNKQSQINGREDSWRAIQFIHTSSLSHLIELFWRLVFSDRLVSIAKQVFA